MNSDLETVYQALVNSYMGLALHGGGSLIADGHVSNPDRVTHEQTPYLGFATGQIETSEWGSEDWTDEVRWTMPAFLVVDSAIDDKGAAMRSVLVDVMQHTRKIRGLPFDKQGRPAYDDFSVDYFARVDSGEVTPLADRKGPHIAAIQVNGPNDSGRYLANLTFRLAFKMNLDPRELRRVKVAILGLRPFDVVKSDIDTSVPFQVLMPRFSDDDRRGTTGFSVPPPLVDDNGVPRYVGESWDATGVVSALPRDLPRELIVNPRTASIAALATQQLSAILIYQDDASQTVTAAASWQSSDPTKATVSATGLVTGVAAGSATITATHLGVSATCAVTVT